MKRVELLRRKQLSRMDSHSLREAADIVDRDVPLGPLDRAHIGAVEPGDLCEPFLREAPGSAKTAKVRGDQRAPVDGLPGTRPVRFALSLPVPPHGGRR